MNKYYNRADVSLCDTVISQSDILQDSTLHGSWTNDYLKYNCYAYAIGREEGLDPGVSLWINLGNEADTYYYNGYANMETIKYWIQSDLEYFEYTVTYAGETRPDTNIGDHVHLICVRKDADGIFQGTANGVDVYFHDYHVMKLEEDGYWYHKPGQTNPLRYTSQPTNADSWLSEGYFLGDDGKFWYFFDLELTYESEIYYIEYTTPHTHDFIYSGSNQHYYGCTICGEAVESAESCNYVYAFIGTVNGINQHTCYCRDCGHIKTEAAFCMYKTGDTCIYCGTSRDTVMEPSSSAPSTTE